MLATAEVYYAAILSKDDRLMGVLRKGGDFHTEMAIVAFSLDVPEQDVLDTLVSKGSLDKATRRCFVETYYEGRRQSAKSIDIQVDVKAI